MADRFFRESQARTRGTSSFAAGTMMTGRDETQLLREPSDAALGTTPPGARTGVPQEMAREAAARLQWLPLLCAGVVIVMLLVQGTLQEEIGRIQKAPLVWLSALSLSLVSVVVFLIQRFGLVNARAMLDIGLLYGVAVALAIGIWENAVPRMPDTPVIGVSRIAVWIVVAALMMTNLPWKTLVAGLASTAMGPLSHWICVWYFGYPPLPWNRLAAQHFFTFAMAICSFLLIRRIYRVERNLSKSKELGSYRLESLIGKGGMGEVWRARHHLLAREAAVKLVRSEVLATHSVAIAEHLRRRFEKEAQATASLRSPNTVVLFDYGVSREGEFYYVMELLDGIDLDTMIEKYGPLPPARVIHFLLQACESLAEAHSLGMVHRDIKLSNLFACRLGLRYDHLKVLDFGLVAGLRTEGEAKLTTAGMTTGTPLFMAPEQALGSQDLDARADLYSLGCVAYALLTGEMVFNEQTPMAVALAHMQQTVIPPSRRTQLPVPESLERAVLGCLQKNREDRPASAPALAKMLRQCTDVPAWTPEDAERWWKIHQPTSEQIAVPPGKP